MWIIITSERHAVIVTASVNGKIGTEELLAMRSHDNVEKVVVREELSDDSELAADIYLYDGRSVFEDMPAIARMAGLSEEAL